MKARKESAVSFSTGNQPGTMGKVFSAFAGAGTNVLALSAWVEGDKGKFLVIAEDSAKAAEAAKSAGYSPSMVDVVVVTTENKVGAGAEIGRKLGEAGVNMLKTFATSGNGSEDMLVMMTEDNDKAVSALS